MPHFAKHSTEEFRAATIESRNRQRLLRERGRSLRATPRKYGGIKRVRLHLVVVRIESVRLTLHRWRQIFAINRFPIYRDVTRQEHNARVRVSERALPRRALPSSVARSMSIALVKCSSRGICDDIAYGLEIESRCKSLGDIRAHFPRRRTRIAAFFFFFNGTQITLRH